MSDIERLAEGPLGEQGWIELAVLIANAVKAGPNGVLGANGSVTDAERWNHVAEAVLTALKAQGWQHVPEGSVVVPREPTDAMVLAGMRHRMAVEKPNIQDTAGIYTAMLDAKEG